MISMETYASWRRKNALEWRDLSMIPAILVAVVILGIVKANLREHTTLSPRAIWWLSQLLAGFIAAALALALGAVIRRLWRRRTRNDPSSP